MKHAGVMKTWILRLRLYWLAAWLYETYRLLLKPHTHGALVALWCQERVLLVQTSYRHELSLPGGGVKRGEMANLAARRELLEELGLELQSMQLGEPWVVTEHSERGRNTVSIYTLNMAEEPEIEVDGLEIIDFHWLIPQQALARNLTTHLRRYLVDYPVS
jgi:8-oxo-dGTP pyrophosphatase MutT (NUDIX family)